MSRSNLMQRYMYILLSTAICLVRVTSFMGDEAYAGEVGGAGSVSTKVVQLEVAPNEDFDEFEDEFDGETTAEVFDPLSPYNRLMTRFNVKFFDWVLHPTARGYNNVVPESARLAVSRFFINLLFPIRFVNNLLQLKVKDASVELARFTVNTTIGIVGFFDPAESWLNLEPHQEDFGQTLGFYGAPGFFHIVLPFFGPSNLRDTVGLAGDRVFTYSTYIYSDNVFAGIDNHTSTAIGTGVESYERLNETSLHLAELESLKKDALDIYILMRDAYEQNRKTEIKD